MDKNSIIKTIDELYNDINELKDTKSMKLNNNEIIYKNIILFFRICIISELLLFILSIVNLSLNVISTIYGIRLVGCIFCILREGHIVKRYNQIIEDKLLEIKKLNKSLMNLNDNENIIEKEQSKEPHTYSFQPNSKSVLQNNDYKIKNNQGKKYIKRR